MSPESKKIRIDKFLSNMGVGSRSDVKKYLKNKRVKVNGEYITSNNVIINTDDDVSFDEIKIVYKEFIYLMMNKPQDVISATEDRLSTTVIDLLDDYYKAFDIFPVGRLDKDTEGLLILTNNGKLAHNMLSPKKHVMKQYYVEVENVMRESDIKAFYNGITLDDEYKCMSAKLEILPETGSKSAYVYIKEGKFHQVKRMFEAVGNKVVYLKRIKMGTIELDELLEPGEYKELNEKEMKLIENYL